MNTVDPSVIKSAFQPPGKAAARLRATAIHSRISTTLVPLISNLNIQSNRHSYNDDGSVC